MRAMLKRRAMAALSFLYAASWLALIGIMVCAAQPDYAALFPRPMTPAEAWAPFHPQPPTPEDIKILLWQTCDMRGRAPNGSRCI